MKILYLCHRIPYPPNKGEKIRAFHQIRALSTRHDVDLLCLADDPRDITYSTNLEEFCRSVGVFPLRRLWRRIASVPYLLTPRALSLPCFYSAALAAAVRRQIRERGYDRIFLYSSVMGQYVKPSDGIPVIADFVDVDSDKWRQYASFTAEPMATVYRREARCLRRFERRLAGHADCVLVSTDREADLLRTIAPAAKIESVPNGVDTEFFDPAAVVRPKDSATIVFTGDMSYFPNEHAVRWFADEVLPIVASKIADVRFTVVGRNPGMAVQALAERPGIEVTGYVADVREYLARASVEVAPFRIAAGIQNKILEAMAYELPVVATTRAAQGVRPGCRRMLCLADDANGFAAHIIRLLRDRAEAAALGAASRTAVRDEYSWGAALQHVVDTVEHPAERNYVNARSGGR